MTDNKPEKIVNSHGEVHNGDQRYFVAPKSRVVHADKHCPNLDSKFVLKKQSCMVDEDKESCNHCTISNPEYKSWF